ncbi:MAG: acetyl-CoA carboxyl transferase, partial [Pseudarthrobacter sp.]|nr:acetyl-CoA carboxyl transferase [Pseudarthrobacter sp.]
MPTTENVRHLSAAELLGAVVDEGSFVSWDTPPEQPVLSGDYARDLAKARDRSGADESVITGAGLIRGRRVALIVSEFSFL